MNHSRHHNTGLIILTAVVAALLMRPVVIRELPRISSVKDIEEITSESVRQLIPSTNTIKYLTPIVPAVDSQTIDSTLSTVGVIDATNRARIQAGFAPLRSNSKLNTSAKAKTMDMITRGYFEHESPGGKGVADLALTSGYDYIVVGENLARGAFIDADDVVNEWMKSPGHRANMLSTNYQEIGTYAAQSVYNGNEVWFAVQHFGTSRMTCPVINTQLKATIDVLAKDLMSRRAQISEEKAILEGPNRPEGEEYKERVGRFNELVAAYNTALVVSQEKSKLYNAQVSAFNTCLNKYRS